MTERERQLRERLLATFKEEARDHIAAMAREVMQLEKAGSPADAAAAIETAFRCAHSLKGASRAVNLRDIESVCQSLETIFAAMKRGQMQVSPELLDLLLAAVRALEGLQEAAEAGNPARSPAIGEVLASLQTATTRHARPQQESRFLGSALKHAGENPPAAPDVASPSAARRSSESDGRGSPSGPAVERTVVPQPPSSVIGADPNRAGRTGSGVAPCVEPAGTSPAAAAVDSLGSMPSPQEKPAAGGIVEAESRAPTAPGAPRKEQLPATERAAAAEETVRVATAKLEALFWQAEDLLLAKLVSNQLTTDARELSSAFHRWRKHWGKLQAEACKWHRLIDAGAPSIPARDVASLLEFVDWNRAYIESLDAQAGGLSQAAAQHQRALSVRVGQLLEDTRQLLMSPCARLLDGFQPLVREMARDLSKDADLIVSGGDLEMDRRVLAELKDPLLHILRNALDHGIETPAERSAAGKPPRATIEIAIAQISGNRIEMRVSDDGRGVNLSKLRAAAVKQEILTDAEARSLDDAAALRLMFHSGVSTSALITDYSGRGLGMSIVREKIERLDGTVTIKSRAGSGTTVRLEAPLTQATFRGVLLRVAEQLFVVPAMKVERVGRISQDQIRSVENRETIESDGAAVAILRMEDVLGLPRSRRETTLQDRFPVVILQIGSTRMAFIVNEILGEQEVLVKSLGRQLQELRNLAGATVLGTGGIALILDVSGLIQDAVALSAAGRAAAAGTTAPAATRLKSILVVEDSITSRTLLKNILESAGYTVTTAVDGVDAFTKLRTEEFHLVVSDVDMPRMNGFALTAKIRADRKLGELPVVLVTALDSREDREQGVDAGANAYIVKRSFEQSNLLEAVRRLL